MPKAMAETNAAMTFSASFKEVTAEHTQLGDTRSKPSSTVHMSRKFLSFLLGFFTGIIIKDSKTSRNYVIS